MSEGESSSYDEDEENKDLEDLIVPDDEGPKRKKARKETDVESIEPHSSEDVEMTKVDSDPIQSSSSSI